MHVKGIFPPFLSSRCMVLRNQFFHNCHITNANKSDSVRSVYPLLRTHLNSKNSSICLNLFKKHLSRYSASTIMRPHTKTFNFKNYDVIGFDLDGTLLRYNLSEMVPLEYELITKYLVQEKGYSKKMLDCLNSSRDKDFWQKGLFIDTDRGNILKLRNDGYILRANHGTKRLSSEEICEIYGKKRQWSVTMQFIEDPLCAWNGPLSEKMRSLLDYFDTSASLVFANAVDDIDSRRPVNERSKQPYQVWFDVLEALIHIYTRENFSNERSEYFKMLKAEPSRYLMKTSPSVIAWLKDLKASNKMLFLLTGSNIDFANFTASYAMGENWQNLFDLVVCFARKPGFFHANRPFYKIEDFKETDPINNNEQIKINSVYSMGNWQQVQQLFAREIGKEVCETKSLYVGDNLIQDVYAPSGLCGIDSVAVSEEILSEYSATNAYNPEQFCFRDIVASNYWGSYFFEDGNPTLWTDIISKYSKMCIPTLDEIATQPIDHQYLMCNEHGFFPSEPREE